MTDFILFATRRQHSLLLNLFVLSDKIKLRMNVEIKPGKYVLAVSGGVDSMVLLDILAARPGLQLIAAHFNHGIRDDAGKDEELVTAAVKRYGVKLETGHANLGSRASEAAARTARYNFLYSIQKKYGADAVVTAHHQDDLLETAVINLLRGTGRKGLTAILANPSVLRPLINVPKKEVLDYAQDHGIRWREDPSNRDLRYLRNYIRHRVIPTLSPSQRQSLLRAIGNMAVRNLEIDEQIKVISRQLRRNGRIDRRLFVLLPSEVATEVVAHWLRGLGYSQFDRRKVQALSLAIKTAKPGTRQPVSRELVLSVGKSDARFETKEVST